ncbi:DMT family transporter [Marininema halotolerans]|uniref:Small multidrug resistance pump n=1 Tax=Marininema halotolerans TaxID=1155944 RepID=A0A1I6S0N1_9BACL|nr:multidrug efflux SMR transporter [Marininema halotolerans]SFS70545.1 small multidrug resistance pump [Marininema halotolerans]
MAWLFLALAIVSEAAGTISMKFSAGFSKPGYAVVMIICYGVSFTFLTIAVKQLDLSLSYAIWSGIGTALVTVAGVFWFQEPVSMAKLFSIGLILAGVIGLKIA